ncbi:MAG TPA: tetratricopeptide repeat protein [Holophagaceae bacterium]|nr:tetratricopeptide repeat protein [Holophagaceae bacterium]
MKALWTTPLLLACSVVQAQVPAPKAPDAAYFSQETRALARVCADEACRLAPHDTKIQAIYGEILLASGEKAKAKEQFELAVFRDPKDTRLQRFVAQAWLRHGFKAEAMENYEAMTAVDLRGRFDNAKNVLLRAATDLLGAGMVKEATAYMERSYALDHDDPNNFIEFARAALKAGQRDLAARYFARAVKAEPNDVDVWLDIGSAYADDQMRAQQLVVKASK